MTCAWQWPQWFMLASAAIGSGFALAKYGQSKHPDKWGIIDILIPWGVLTILYFGGFFP